MPPPPTRGRLQGHPTDAADLYLLIAILLTLATVLGIGLLALHLRARKRELLLLRLLESTDALEALLHATRQRMSAMKSVVERVPSDIAAVAQASLDADAPVQQGLRNVLEHRLWIARNAATASTEELRRAVEALDRSHRQIESRLQQLEDAGAALAEATRPVIEQQQREPPSLRRVEPGGGPNGRRE